MYLSRFTDTKSITHRFIQQQQLSPIKFEPKCPTTEAIVTVTIVRDLLFSYIWINMWKGPFWIFWLIESSVL